jgi:hypothetical protein
MLGCVHQRQQKGRNMRKSVQQGLLVSGLVSISSIPALASVYSGNASTGFGGPVGNGSLTLTDSGGVLTVSVTTGAALNGNDIVLYIDSSPGSPDLNPGDSPGYYTSTTSLTDDGDGGREAISGYNSGNGPSRTVATFASGFYADYAIDVQNTTANLFGLPSQNNVGNGNNSLNYITGTSYSGTNSSGETYTLSFNLSAIGVTPGNSFDIVGTLISETAYRSNETFAASTTTPDNGGDAPNAGFNGSTTFSAFDVYATTAVPEPASLGLLGGIAAGLLARRRVKD